VERSAGTARMMITVGTRVTAAPRRTVVKVDRLSRAGARAAAFRYALPPAFFNPIKADRDDIAATTRSFCPRTSPAASDRLRTGPLVAGHPQQPPLLRALYGTSPGLPSSRAPRSVESVPASEPRRKTCPGHPSRSQGGTRRFRGIAASRKVKAADGMGIGWWLPGLTAGLPAGEGGLRRLAGSAAGEPLAPEQGPTDRSTQMAPLTGKRS
jgi:hypothetical protein